MNYTLNANFLSPSRALTPSRRKPQQRSLAIGGRTTASPINKNSSLHTYESSNNHSITNTETNSGLASTTKTDELSNTERLFRSAEKSNSTLKLPKSSNNIQVSPQATRRCDYSVFEPNEIANTRLERHENNFNNLSPKSFFSPVMNKGRQLHHQNDPNNIMSPLFAAQQVTNSDRKENNLSLEDAWHERIKQIQRGVHVFHTFFEDHDSKRGDSQNHSFEATSNSPTSNDSPISSQSKHSLPKSGSKRGVDSEPTCLFSPQPFTPFPKNVVNLQTPTPFRKHSGDIEKYKPLINREQTPGGDSPFLENFEKNKHDGDSDHDFDQPCSPSFPIPNHEEAAVTPQVAVKGQQHQPVKLTSQQYVTSPSIVTSRHVEESVTSIAEKPYDEKLNSKTPTSQFKSQRPNNTTTKLFSKNTKESSTLQDINQLKEHACQLLHEGLLQQSAETAQECKQLILKTFGTDSEHLIYVFILLGECYTHLAKFKEAKFNLLEAKRILDRKFNSKSENRTLALYCIQIFNDLGYLMKLQGKYKLAIEMYRKHLMLKLKYFPSNSNEVASAYNQLGVVYTMVGSFDHAMESLNRAKKLREALFGSSHIETATVYNNIGNVYLYKGEYLSALNQYKQGKEIIENCGMIDHPDFATSLVNMATCLKGLKQYEESLLLYEKALNIREKVLGERHNSTISCFVMIGNLHLCSGNLKQAEDYISHATSIREHDLGLNNVDTGFCYLSMGNIKQQAGEYELALGYYRTVKEIFLEHFGEKHPDTLLVYENMASVYMSMGNWNAALELLFKMVNAQQELSQHPSLATIFNNIGNIFRQQGRNDEAFEYYQKARLIFEKVYGFEHEWNAVIYTNIGHLYFSSFQNNTNDVEMIKALSKNSGKPLNRSSCTMRRSSIGMLSPEESRSFIQNLKINEALKFYTQAKSIRERLFGSQHMETVKSYQNLALVYSAMKNYTLAYQYIANCKKIQEMYFPNQEIEMKETSRIMAEIVRESSGKVNRKSSGVFIASSPARVGNHAARNNNQTHITVSTSITGSRSLNSLLKNNNTYT
ncbi:hypothetical protein C9374_011517 [Naegleria lovaniensis]|uniref:Kinesin light chain n=1 Tax=Naegleria lovaniensis TaxID=51637 RepID=A0AA88H4E4_NAELO|nr:uncharacterized protein C9374_011517 [Naegleria lovaniensis]KAG2392792.1 hypothetical protein C9374_011517 [Naegleria lovaniensis]